MEGESKLEIAIDIRDNGYNCGGVDCDCHQCPFEGLDCFEDDSYKFTIRKDIVDNYITSKGD